MTRVLVTLTGAPEEDDVVHSVREHHLRALRDAGLVPVLAPGTLPPDALAELLGLCACAYLPGTDYVPSRRDEAEEDSAREAARAGLPPDPWKVGADLAVLDLAWGRRLPVLGVCGGMQAMVIAAGGALRAAAPAELARHEHSDDPEPLAVIPDTLLAATLSPEERVNSRHRQVVAEVRAPLRVAARAADGVIEAVDAESGAHPFWLGLQWHPDLLGDPRPYAGLASAARAFESGSPPPTARGAAGRR